MNHQKRFQEEIIVFTRYPQPGHAKTRLIPVLGIEGAAEVQRIMTEQVVRAARQVARERNRRLSVYYTGGSRQLMEKWLGSGPLYRVQEGDDLGLKMLRAFSEARERGAKRVVLIGSDCPSIDGRMIENALASLQESTLTLGPAADGGYYLVGMVCDLETEVLHRLFKDIEWGSATVFQTTVDRACRAGVTISILEELHDIDLPQDLAHFRYHPDPQ